MALIPEFYKDSVVAIGTRSQNKITWLATGFVVGQPIEADTYNLFLVTNRHVINGKNEIVVRFNISGKLDAKDYDIRLLDENGSALYSVHPNKDVDVACMMLNPQVLASDIGDISAFFLDKYSLERAAMIDNELVEGTVVYSLGFPSGIVGLHTKTPLCRMGCICRFCEPYLIEESYLIDIQNFPGSSGSPVINKLEGYHLEDTKFYNKTSLIGIIAAYLPYQDALRSQQTGDIMQIIQENSGIAVVYTVDAIKATLDVEIKRVNALLADKNVA